MRILRPRRIMPAQRTLEALRRRGYRTQKVERWIAIPCPLPGFPPGRRVDLFGFIDGIALDMTAAGQKIIGWQACPGSVLSEHLKKITGECHEAAVDWLLSGGRIQVWAWRAVKPRGTKRKLWKPLIVELVLGEDGRIVEAYRSELLEYLKRKRYEIRETERAIDRREGLGHRKASRDLSTELQNS